MIPPMTNETLVIDLNEACSPKKYPMEVIIMAHIADAIKKMNDVIFVFVLASPATIGMNALTDGMSLPTKM